MTIVCLMGPTATGKTDIAVELVQRLPMEIVSVDSAMVYRGMDIGTAKPSREVLSQAPHRLIDICEPTERYSAACFRQDALDAIGAIESDGKIPLLVGGTGLYFRALEQGLSILPGADTSIRARLDAERREHGLSVLYQRLCTIDPESARRIDANDPQRIQRALEVYEITGKPMTELFTANAGQPLRSDWIKIVLQPACRDTHRELCKTRFEHMLADGLIHEVEGLYQRGDLSKSLPSMRMVGYRQVWQYLAGSLDYEAMQKHAIIATRQLAKRQMTWFRKENNVEFINSQDTDRLQKVINSLSDHPKYPNFR